MHRHRLWSLGRDLLRFGMVGGLGMVVDVGLFNTLLIVLPAVPAAPLIAKTVSITAAIATNWAGNRWWAFRDRRGARPGREAFGFLVISLAGSAIALACLGISHYLLGFTTTFDDNISANVVGLVLGSAFRFVAVRTWLFRHTIAPEPGYPAVPSAMSTR